MYSCQWTNKKLEYEEYLIGPLRSETGASFTEKLPSWSTTKTGSGGVGGSKHIILQHNYVVDLSRSVCYSMCSCSTHVIGLFLPPNLVEKRTVCEGGL